MKLDNKREIKRLEEKLSGEYYKEVIEEANNLLQGNQLNEIDRMSIESLLVKTYFCISEYQIAIQHAFNALEKAKQIEDLATEGRVYLNLIGCYGRMGDRASALCYAKEALNSYRLLQDDKGLSSAYANMGVIYVEMKDTKNARIYFEKSLEYLREDDEVEITLWMNLANLDLEEALYEQALELLKKSIECAKKTGNKRLLTYGYKTIASAFEMLEDYESAEDAIYKAMEIQKDIDDKHEICECYIRLSSLAEKKGECPLALTYLKQSQEIREAFLFEENKEKIESLQKAYEIKEKNRYLTQNKELKALNKELIEANEKIKQLSEEDFLTGIFNRRGFQEAIVKFQETCKNQFESHKVLLVDIDYFKGINDDYGHNVGDKVLVSVAQILREVIQCKGIVGRWGGEEFIIFVPYKEQVEVVQLAYQIKDAIGLKRFKLEKESIHITVTIGISQSRDCRLEEQIKEADNNLYKGKNWGRNCVIG